MGDAVDATTDPDENVEEVTIIGDDDEHDVRKTTDSGSSVRMTVTDFAEPQQHYKIKKTEDGFLAEKIEY